MTVIPFARDATLRNGDSTHGVGIVSYNGVRFPPAIHSNAKYDPVYDDSGRIMKYLHGSITIEAYLFPGCLDTPDSVSGQLRLPYYDAGRPADGAINHLIVDGHDCTTDETLETIRKRLSEPCQPLSFTDQGFGDISLNQVNSGGAPTGPQDVANGPKPKEVSWTPLTNKMAKVVWTVEFSFSPCANTTTGVMPSLIAQFPFEVTITNDNAGRTTRTITGSIEKAVTRFPTNGASAGVSQFFDMKATSKYVLSFFPLLKQFTREQSFTMSNDRRTVNFTITDTEINSDNPFGPGIAHEEATLSLQGQLNPGAFRQWTVGLHGSIEVLAGFPKTFAYNEIAYLYNNLFIKRAVSGTLPNRNEIPKWVEGLGITSKITKASIPILRSAKYEDHLFSRTVNFAFTWDLFVTLETLFKATGIFQLLESSASVRSAKWESLRVDVSNVLQDKVGYADLGFTDSNDIIVSLCQPILGKPYPAPAPPKQPEDSRPKSESDSKDTTSSNTKTPPKDAYSAYQVQFEIDMLNNTAAHTALGYLPLTIESLSSKLRESTVMSKFPESSESKAQTKKVFPHKIRPDQYRLKFKGAAIRLGYPVPVPSVKSYGGQQLVKVGTDLIRPVVLGSGIDAKTGNSYTINGLMWEKSYILPNTPIDATIESDGHSNYYV